MKTIDTRGELCPIPLIRLKEALLEAKPGEVLKVETDNDTSMKNLVSYLKDQGVEPDISSEGGVHTLHVTVPHETLTSVSPASYCSSDLPADYVVCIKGELMGEGDPELGKVLMETFVDNLKLQEHLPSHVVLYNSGVKLAMKSSPACSSLAELEELGTRIMLCGTCVDYYGIQLDLGVGMISNMVSLTETLALAGHIIYP